MASTLDPYRTSYDIVAAQIPDLDKQFTIMLYGDSALLRVEAEFSRKVGPAWSITVPLETMEIGGKYHSLKIPDWAISMLLLRMD